MTPRKYIISALQLITAVLVFPLFFSFVPWAFASAVSDLSPKEQLDHPPPGEAKYYTVNHGHYVFFDTSPREEPLRALLHGGAIVGCVAFLIVSAKRSTKQEESCKNSDAEF